MGIKHLVGLGWVLTSPHSFQSIGLLVLHPQASFPEGSVRVASISCLFSPLSYSGAEVGLGPQVGQGMVVGRSQFMCVHIFFLLLNKQL